MSDARRPRRRRHSNRAPGASGSPPGSPPDNTGQTSVPPEGSGEPDQSRPFVRVRRVDRSQRKQRSGPDLVPRPSRMRYVLLFFIGVFVGRAAQVNFTPEVLSILSLITYGAIALGIAWMWRSWARRAMEQRHLQAQRRQERGSQQRDATGRRARPATPPEDDPGERQDP